MHYPNVRGSVLTLVFNIVLVLIYICMKVLIATPLVIVVVVDAVKIIFSVILRTQ